MLYEDRKKEIETIKERTLVLKLSDADCDRILQSVIHVIPERKTILYTIRTVRKLFHGIMKFPYCERPSRKKRILTAIRTLQFRMMKSAVFRQYRKMAAKPSLLKTADLYLQAVKN